MEKGSARIPAFFLAIITLLGWFALIGQFYLILQNKQASTAETIVRYFSFFTILTNLLVAICVTVLLVAPSLKWGVFFSKATTLTAITVYITIVGLVYNAILRFLWQPKGLQYAVDELLHTVIPLLFIFLWRMWVPRSGLKYKNVWTWLIYPLIYVIYTVIRGAITGYYPYPFIDVTKLGYGIVLVNTVGLLAAFLGLSLLLVASGKLGSKKEA
jgi:hypothetical protein